MFTQQFKFKFKFKFQTFQNFLKNFLTPEIFEKFRQRLLCAASSVQLQNGTTAPQNQKEKRKPSGWRRKSSNLILKLKYVPFCRAIQFFNFKIKSQFHYTPVYPANSSIQFQHSNHFTNSITKPFNICFLYIFSLLLKLHIHFHSFLISLHSLIKFTLVHFQINSNSILFKFIYFTFNLNSIT